ncbi:MAG: hypothetical protein U0175_33235 [Caldilineaceae bacterium]
MDSPFAEFEDNSLLSNLKRWHLSHALLLFLAGHRPLAFIVGQGLYLFTPLAELVGFAKAERFAQLLSQPEGMAWLEQALRDQNKT